MSSFSIFSLVTFRASFKMVGTGGAGKTRTLYGVRYSMCIEI